MGIPTLIEAIRLVEKKLSTSLNGKVNVSTHTKLDEQILESVMAIDHAKFRQNLWYNRDELRNRMNKAGFFCLILYLDCKPIAYDFGYDDEDEGVFFSDSSATAIERKGVGTLLALLETVYLYEEGYSAVKFTTEELDQDGRPLRQIWENLGYRVIDVDADNTVTMMLDVTKETVIERVKKHLPIENIADL